MFSWCFRWQGFLVQDNWTKAFKLIKTDLPTTMAPLDRNTAENNVRSLQMQEDRAAELQRFESEFKIKVRLVTSDRHPANIRAEQCLKSRNPGHTTLSFPCDIHKEATALKHGLRPVEDVISGIVNTGLAVETIGSLNALREILQDIFSTELRIAFCQPPVENTVHCKDVLDLFCPVTGLQAAGLAKNKKRQLVLKYFCNSDLNMPDIIHFCPPGCCPSPEATRRCFLSFVTWALLPKKCGVLSRKSWVGADTSTNWVGLLSAFWGLHEKILVRYTGYAPKELGSQSAEKAQAAAGLLAAQDEADGLGLGVGNVAEWGPLISAVLPETEADQEQEPNPNQDMDLSAFAKQSWAEFNRSCQKKAGAFATSKNLCSQLTVVRQAMQPGLSLIHNGLEMASWDWEKQQRLSAAQGRGRKYRVVETAQGTLIATSLHAVREQLLALPRALPLTCYNYKTRGLLFRLLSGFACSVSIVQRAHQGFPYQLLYELFHLLGLASSDIDDEQSAKGALARKVYSLPHCFWDEMAKDFFKWFLHLQTLPSQLRRRCSNRWPWTQTWTSATLSAAIVRCGSTPCSAAAGMWQHFKKCQQGGRADLWASTTRTSPAQPNHISKPNNRMRKSSLSRNAKLTHRMLQVPKKASSEEGARGVLF